MRDPTFGEKLSERMWKSEGLFAEAKQNHNLARAKYRGRAKVQIQAYLSGIAQNLNLAIPINALKDKIKADYPGKRKFGKGAGPSPW